jgi:hypothetical protein
MHAACYYISIGMNCSILPQSPLHNQSPCSIVHYEANQQELQEKPLASLARPLFTIFPLFVPLLQHGFAREIERGRERERERERESEREREREREH